MHRLQVLRHWALLMLAIVAFKGERALAGAWPEAQGHDLMIDSVSWFQCSSSYGPKGSVSRYSARGRFRQFVANPYIEIGMTPRTTLILNPSIPYLEYQDIYNQKSSGGLGDFEVSVRRRLNSAESPWAVSGQFTWMFPAYSSTQDPAPGNHQQDFEARFLTGHGGSLGGRHVFWDVEGAYRFRTGAPADQVRADGNAGLSVTRRFMLLAQLFSITGMRNGTPVRPNSNPNAQSDFDLYKWQASTVVSLTDRTRVQMGWGRTFAGRNTGRGATVVLGLWRTF